MSIPFENPIPVLDKFKGWYAQTTAMETQVANGADYEWNDPKINYLGMFDNGSSYGSKVTINESGTYYIDCLVNGYGNPLLTHLNRLRGGTTDTLAIGYGNNSGLIVYIQAIINGYFELEAGDVITIQNASGGAAQFRGNREGNTWWAGKLVATVNA